MSRNPVVMRCAGNTLKEAHGGPTPGRDGVKHFQLFRVGTLHTRQRSSRAGLSFDVMVTAYCFLLTLFLCYS